MKRCALPIRTLANEYGISDVGLKEICRRHDIPNTRPSHWAKVARRKTDRQAPDQPSGMSEWF
jgi:hypothetical protein